MIITPNSLKINQLLGAQSEQYVIPAYQRRYSWNERQLEELLDDIKLIEGSDTHLLGSIVCLTGQHTAGINKLELVDGQQRLISISILLQCILDRLKIEGENAEAASIENFLTCKALGGKPQQKILVDSIDALEYSQLAASVSNNVSGNVKLAEAFALYRKWVAAQDLAAIGSFLYRLMNQAIVIRLDVGDAKDAFKLFETINNRGLKLSPTDIIKNFVLGNAARFGSESLTLARAMWTKLIAALDGTSFESFFRNFLCARLKRRITVSYVIANFKEVFMKQVLEAKTLPERHLYFKDDSETDDTDEALDFEDDQDAVGAIPETRISFAAFMGQLVDAANIYGTLARGDTGNKAIDRRLRNLRLIKANQTYGFLMAMRSGGCADGTFVDVLKFTEAFLLRRHICRERSNENETLFARLCAIDAMNPLPQLIAEYRRFSPSDAKFVQEFADFAFVPGLIDRARYCLEQFESSAQGSHAELLVSGSDLVQVEHIIPQKIKSKKAKEAQGDWLAYLGQDADAKHSKHVAKIGNLTLFAGPLNLSASNNPYERKKLAYVKSSLKITSTLPADYAEFRFEDVTSRSGVLAHKAVEIWPIP